MKISHKKLKRRRLHRIQMDFNILCDCPKFAINKSTVGSFFKEHRFKTCLTKQLLNMFKLWCEWGKLHVR